MRLQHDVGTTMDMRDLAGALWRRRLLVLLIWVITGVAVAAGLWLAPKSYTATATVAAMKDPSATAGPEDLNDLRARIAVLATSRDVVLAVQERLRVDSRVDRSLADLYESIRGEWVPGTVLVRITTEDADPQVAADIANLVAAALAEAPAVHDVLIVEISGSARPPSRFSSPDLLLVLLIGAAVGLIASVAAAAARDRRASTVDDAAAVEHAAVAPLLAHLSPPEDLTAMPTLRPGTAAADRFRHLRLALDAEASASDSHKVVFTGVTTGDVTVWLAANVAIALAGVGRRVLLVDGRMGERFGRPIEAEPDTPGLYDVLSGVAIEDALSPGPVELLSVLPSGNWGEEPVESLLANRFDAVMENAAADFDVIVVLAPPLDGCDDARLMAVGGSLVLAVPQGGLSTTTLRAHADRVRATGTRLLGVVLIGRRTEAMAV